MTSLKIAHISDTHLGYRSMGVTNPRTNRNVRSEDFERSFQDAVTKMLDARPDLIIHAGDVFDMPRPDYRAIKTFIDQWGRIERSGIPNVVISGNHDISRIRTLGTVYDVLISSLPGTHFVAGWHGDSILFRDLGTEIMCMPWAGDTLMPSDLARWSDAEWKILLSHGGVKTNLTDPDMRFAGGDPWFDTSDYDYVALGDHHLSYRVADKTWYSGSTERCGFSDERASPGFLIVDLEKHRPPFPEHQPVLNRPMATLEPVEWDETALTTSELVVERVREFNDDEAILRIEVINAPHRSLGMTQAMVDRALPGRTFGVRLFSAGQGLNREIAPLSAKFSGPLDVPTLFEEFVKERAYEAEGFTDRFREVGRKSIESAIQKDKEGDL